MSSPHTPPQRSHRQTPSASLGLRAGDWVVVRSKEEILATLDGRGRLDELPFQAEMFAHCGQRLRVVKVAHKTCDTIHKTGGRRMYRAVHLEGAHCDGASHGGCQADCTFFWKEAWLRRATGADVSAPALVSIQSRCTEEGVVRASRAPGEESSDDPTWVCQTTALYEATEPLQWWDVRQYVRDVTTGNHSAWHMCKLLIFAGYRRLFMLGRGHRLLVWIYNSFQRVRGGKPFPVDTGLLPKGKPTPAEKLNLQPGELVWVKPIELILATIDADGFNRGMRFDLEMAKYCGERFRVQMRVDRLIHEQTGKMLVMKTPCVQLENVYCRAECTPKRLGCPRAMNTYWREIWLQRVDSGSAGAH